MAPSQGASHPGSDRGTLRAERSSSVRKASGAGVRSAGAKAGGSVVPPAASNPLGCAGRPNTRPARPRRRVERSGPPPGGAQAEELPGPARPRREPSGAEWSGAEVQAVASVADVDQRLLAQLAEIDLRLPLHVLAAELVADVVLDLVEGLGVLDLAIDQLDDVEAPVDPDRATDVADLHGEDQLLDRLRQHVLAEVAEVAAVGARRRVVRRLARQLGEVFA